MNKCKPAVFCILLAILMASCSQPDKPISTSVQAAPSALPVQEEVISKQSQNSVMDLIQHISNIPSPTADLRYVTQSANVFEVKFGDGSYSILSSDTYPLKLDCSNANSMKPVFDCNDKVLLKRVEEESELGVGDIIVYDSPSLNTKVIHRLVKIQGGRFYTRADNWNGVITQTDGKIDYDDGSVPFGNIQYKVVGIVYQ